MTSVPILYCNFEVPEDCKQYDFFNLSKSKQKQSMYFFKVPLAKISQHANSRDVRKSAVFKLNLVFENKLFTPSQLWNEAKRFCFGEVRARLIVRLIRPPTKYYYIFDTWEKHDGYLHQGAAFGYRIRLRTTSTLFVFDLTHFLLFLGATAGLAILSDRFVDFIIIGTCVCWRRRYLRSTYLQEVSFDFAKLPTVIDEHFAGDEQKAMHEIARARARQAMTFQTHEGEIKIRDTSEHADRLFHGVFHGFRRRLQLSFVNAQVEEAVTAKLREVELRNQD